jgi:hypothetical protein
MNVRRVQAIARKEYYHLIRDFRSLYLAFIIPLLLILLFGYALSLDVEHIPTAVDTPGRRRAVISPAGWTLRSISTSSPTRPPVLRSPSCSTATRSSSASSSPPAGARISRPTDRARCRS